MEKKSKEVEEATIHVGKKSDQALADVYYTDKRVEVCRYNKSQITS